MRAANYAFRCTASNVTSSYCSRFAICVSKAAMTFWIRGWADGAGEVDASTNRSSPYCSSVGLRCLTFAGKLFSCRIVNRRVASHSSREREIAPRTGTTCSGCLAKCSKNLLVGGCTRILHHICVNNLFQLIGSITDIFKQGIVCSKIFIQDQPK